MLGLVPMLYHLIPPVTCTDTAITRFAPLEADPQRFGFPTPHRHHERYDILFSRQFLERTTFSLDSYAYYFARSVGYTDELSRHSIGNCAIKWITGNYFIESASWNYPMRSWKIAYPSWTPGLVRLAGIFCRPTPRGIPCVRQGTSRPSPHQINAGESRECVGRGCLCSGTGRVVGESPDLGGRQHAFRAGRPQSDRFGAEVPRLVQKLGVDLALVVGRFRHPNVCAISETYTTPASESKAIM